MIRIHEVVLIGRNEIRHAVEGVATNAAIQELLGHRSPATTALYTHITPQLTDVLQRTINALMAPL